VNVKEDPYLGAEADLVSPLKEFPPTFVSVKSEVEVKFSFSLLYHFRKHWVQQ